MLSRQVMVSTSGTQLLPHVAVKELREHLLPLATILTPNIPEARLLVENDRGFEYPEPKTTDDLITLAKDVQQLGSKWVLLKGGHMPMIDGHLPIPAKTYEACIVINILCNETLFIPIESAYIQSTSTHGTGCSLACKWECIPDNHPSFPESLYSCPRLQLSSWL